MPELGGIATSLVPALLKIFAMPIDFGCSVERLSLWKSMCADPAANRPYTHATVTGNFVLSDPFANLLHNCR
jgi:hypothetical protein